MWVGVALPLLAGPRQDRVARPRPPRVLLSGVSGEDCRTTQEGGIENQRASVGYVLVIVGAVAFAVAAFLPFIRSTGQLLPSGASASLYRETVNTPGLDRNLTHAALSTAWLFAGPVLLLVLGLLGLFKRPRPVWVPITLVVLTAFWALGQVNGFVLWTNLAEGDVALAVGYWVTVGAVTLAVLGAVLVATSRGKVAEPVSAPG